MICNLKWNGCLVSYIGWPHFWDEDLGTSAGLWISSNADPGDWRVRLWQDNGWLGIWVEGMPSGVIKRGWKMPELNGGFNRKITKWSLFQQAMSYSIINADIFRTCRPLAGDHCGLRQWLSSRLAMYQEGLHRSLLEDQEWSWETAWKSEVAGAMILLPHATKTRPKFGRAARSDSPKSGRDPDIFQGKRCNVMQCQIFYISSTLGLKQECRRKIHRESRGFRSAGDPHPGLAEGGGEHQISSMSWAHQKVRWLCKWSWLRRVESLQEGIEMWRCHDLIPAYSSGFYLLVNS